MSDRVKLMKFGYMLDFRNPSGSGLSARDFHAAMLEQAEYVDRAGLDSIWLTEHHFVARSEERRVGKEC